MGESDTFKIRPAGRHLLTIGEDLIHDKFAAIIELVKNAYDADSSDAVICFKSNETKEFIEIVVEDHGHGMSRSDVVDKWLVPSTDYKVNHRKSPNGRIMQGRKGIGRYAASILGDDLFLETIDKKGEKTQLYVDWSQFSKFKYLDEIEIMVESEKVKASSGTKLTMHGLKKEYLEWSNLQLNKLRFELKKLIPPKTPNIFNDSFKIILKFDNFFDNQKNIIIEEIEPYPILDLFDYKITGEINADGTGIFLYTNQKIRNSLQEQIYVDYGPTLCGKPD